jgi:hypothetical protein
MSEPRRLTHLLGGLAPPRDWLTMVQLAEHGKFMAECCRAQTCPSGPHYSQEAARKYVARHKDLPRVYVGRKLRVDRGVFDRYLTTAARGVA